MNQKVNIPDLINSYFVEDENDRSDCEDDSITNKCLSRQPADWTRPSDLHDNKCKTKSLNSSC